MVQEGDVSALPKHQQMPISVLSEGTIETRGNQAQRNNITAAKLIAELVKSALGPRGRDKMLVGPAGDVTITNDGATILKEIEIEHPAAKMMVEVAKSVDNEVGDGTTSAVVLAGALVERAEDLISQRVHPTAIVEGYQMASEKAVEFMKEAATELKDPLGEKDRETLIKIAQTSIASKLVSTESADLARIVVKAVLDAAEELGRGEIYRTNEGSQEGGYGSKVDADNIKVDKKAGGSLHDTQLVRGIFLDKEVVHGGMPKRIQGAKIALLSAPMEIERTEVSTEIRISDPREMQSFLEEQNRVLKGMADKVVAAGANVVLCQKGIGDVAQHYLARAGILAVQDIGESDMLKLAKATGAIVVNNIGELSASDLGSATLVEERKVEADRWVFIEGCKSPKAISILIRGGSQRVVDEAERSVHDAIRVIRDVVEHPFIIAGGGAPEALAAHRLQHWGRSLSGRAQLAASKFADALETIPITIAANAGMDPLDTQAQLRSKVAESTAKKEERKAKYGIDVIDAKVTDVAKQNIMEPLVVKEQIINAATEAASMILRIDQVIVASKPKSTEDASSDG